MIAAWKSMLGVSLAFLTFAEASESEEYSSVDIFEPTLCQQPYMWGRCDPGATLYVYDFDGAACHPALCNAFGISVGQLTFDSYDKCMRICGECPKAAPKSGDPCASLQTRGCTYDAHKTHTENHAAEYWSKCICVRDVNNVHDGSWWCGTQKEFEAIKPWDMKMTVYT